MGGNESRRWKRRERYLGFAEKFGEAFSRREKMKSVTETGKRGLRFGELSAISVSLIKPVGLN